MSAPRRTSLTLALTCIISGAGISTVHAADGTELTLYRSDSASLYASSGDGSIELLDTCIDDAQFCQCLRQGIAVRLTLTSDRHINTI